MCPTQAISSKDPLRVNQIDEKLCIGCGECVRACPFGAISIPPGEEFPISCDLCGGDPQCVQCCPNKVLTYQSDEGLAKAKRKKLVPHQESANEKT
jgi:Fe-S-cluster-containing hydrogenase component 2